jgi:hypothetical protein
MADSFNPVPDWLKPANPAEYKARGMGIGLEAAAQRAAQQFREAQLAREDQRMQVEQAQHAAEFGLKQQQAQMEQQQAQQAAQAAAAKMAAMQGYQDAVTGGMDPMKALIQFGPPAGMPGAPEAAAIQAQMTRPAPTWQKQDIGGIPALTSSAGGLRFPPRPPAAPEQWSDTTKTVGGAQIPGQVSSRSGRFMPLGTPGADLPGLTPQQKQEQQIKTLRGQMSAMEKDPMMGEFILGTMTPKPGSNSEKALGPLMQKYQGMKKQLEGITGPAQPTAPGLKFVRADDGSLVPSGPPQQQPEPDEEPEIPDAE